MLWLVSCVRRALYMTQALPGWVGVTGHLRKQIIHMLLRKTMKKKTVVFKRIDALMIHHSGHISSLENDLRPEQKDISQHREFMPIAMNYRLRPDGKLIP
ncbi:uncharacterized protein N7525_005765 [Penicillium rubens]|uniref:uncharacterized protein n=1 Tax=Penicillium rubens TaxID=1108849 RepID=UPI002A59FF6E|nr:uncharacterized protein N7525_005765 [Penicillium rubens]KAJ5840577.1 hypothetical protein N7525_005765 [Penicillium rubens]KAJ5868555.1 hypothetical protein N7534_003108 [Penicillium rubens]